MRSASSGSVNWGWITTACRPSSARNRADLTTRLAATRSRLADDHVRVLVIGEFKQGKSQLVNALVRARVCPVGGHPCLNSIDRAEVVAAVADLAARVPAEAGR